MMDPRRSSGTDEKVQMDSFVEQPPNAGACTNAADQDVRSSKGDAWFSDSVFTSLGCLASWEDEHETTRCIKDKEGYSQGCAACQGALLHCWVSKCGNPQACPQAVLKMTGQQEWPATYLVEENDKLVLKVPSESD